jgi:hypothetical protein
VRVRSGFVIAEILVGFFIRSTTASEAKVPRTSETETSIKSFMTIPRHPAKGEKSGTHQKKGKQKESCFSLFLLHTRNRKDTDTHRIRTIFDFTSFRTLREKEVIID